MRPLIIEAALNELMDKASNPHVPYGPEEVAIDAAACVEAGASMLHFHARDAQTGDQLWTSTETYVDAMRRIYGLGVARDVLFYPTYEWLTEEQLTHVVALRQHPDVRLALAALDVGAVLLNEFDAATSTFERADWGCAVVTACAPTAVAQSPDTCATCSHIGTWVCSTRPWC
jgi:uncharacterized protein (DUF849 family)